MPTLIIKKNVTDEYDDCYPSANSHVTGKVGHDLHHKPSINPLALIKCGAESHDKDNSHDGVSCSLCGEFQDDADQNNTMNVDEIVAVTMLKKCFPATLLRHDPDSTIICGDCAQLLRIFSDFVDKVMTYQNELMSRSVIMRDICGAGNGTVNQHRSVALSSVPVSTNPVFIKQEPINVKQEIVDITSKRATIQPDIMSTAFSVFSQSTASPVTVPLIKRHGEPYRPIIGTHTSSFCGFCDRIFVNNYELESHVCNTERHQRRDVSCTTNNNCEIMEIITLNNTVSYIDLAADDGCQPMANRAMKIEHPSDFECRDRIESDHAYAKRIEVYNPKLKQEINYDSTDSYESNIEVYEPSQNSLTVDLSNNNSGCESDTNDLNDLNDLNQFVLPKTMMVTVSELHSCTKCDIRFENALALQEHCRSMHALKNKVCSVCSTDFKSIHDYLVHKNKMHAVGYQCSQCRRSFAFKHALSNHKRFSCSPGTSDQFYSCKYCGKRFRNRMSMNDHCKMCSTSILEEDIKESGELKNTMPAIDMDEPIQVYESTSPVAQSPVKAAQIAQMNVTPMVQAIPVISERSIMSTNSSATNCQLKPKKMLACEVCGSRFSKRFNMVRFITISMKHFQCSTYFIF